MSAALAFAASIALLLCSLTTGFLFAFAVVVMPGLKALDDAAYLRAFQVVDRVIQEGQPLFMVMWVGSIIALLSALAMGLGTLAGLDRLALLGASGLYLGGAQVPTAAINVPLNNRVQKLNIDETDSGSLREARRAFEGRWNRWNARRTGLAVASVILMIVLLARL
jgi:uncharacterized membrane protein